MTFCSKTGPGRAAPNAIGGERTSFPGCCLVLSSGLRCLSIAREDKTKNPIPRAAFTLVELLILMLIITVLVATILPQFSVSARDANMSNLKFNLRTMRSRLETYKEDHGGVYPPAVNGAEFKAQMKQRSDRNCLLNPLSGKCGPYIEGNLPINPFNNSSSVAVVQTEAEPSTSTGSGDGWQYNAKHGWFYPNDDESFRIPGGCINPSGN